MMVLIAGIERGIKIKIVRLAGILDEPVLKAPIYWPYQGFIPIPNYIDMFPTFMITIESPW
jgi:hypothetical protein